MNESEKSLTFFHCILICLLKSVKMIYKEHQIQLIVNGENVELKSQKDFNLTLNNTIFDPKELSSTQAEYSFEFTIPATPNNNKVFNYANCLDKSNRFHERWKAQLYADEQLIFDGTLIINSFKDNEYSVNLVSPKVYDLDDIFGESKLTDIPWFIDFDGVPSINQYNREGNNEAMFPLISYGVFEKEPYYSDEVANDYTSKFQFDKWNRWYVESFYPSLNMLATIKKAFEWKGYNVGGDIFADSDLKDIYMSCNLANEQVPLYNLGNPKFGEIQFSLSSTTTGSGYEQELQFPYFHLKNRRYGFGGAGIQTNTTTPESWNFKAIRIYDLMKTGTTEVSDSYMYDPNEKLIVIPADGWYRISLDIETRLNYTTSSFTAAQSIITEGGNGNDIEDKNLQLPIGLDEFTPIEIQLVRNYSDNIELIKGKWNKEYANGNPLQTQYQTGSRWTNNVAEWRTCFPHEDPYNSDLPTKTNNLNLRNTQSAFGGQRNYGGTTPSVTRGGSRTSSENTGFGSGRGTGGTRVYNSSMFGYVPRDMRLMAYDPAVNGDFICGFSSFGKGQCSVIKNGYSWSKSYADKHEAFYNQDGYMQLYRQQGSSDNVEESATTFNKNTYSGAPFDSFSTGAVVVDGKSLRTSMYGKVYCCVYLHKNDRLELFEIHRAYDDIYGNAVNYSANTIVRFKMKAMSEHNMAYLLNEGFSYSSDTEFDTKLRLSNFMNQETTISSFIQSILDAFNLQMTQEGKNIFINKRSNPLNNSYPPVIDFDNRVNGGEVESESIEFPSSLAVRYKTDTEECGFEKTVPADKLNDEDWKDYGDSGFTVIQISDDDYNTDKQEKSLNFSYTWYDNFNWMEVDSADTENSGNTISLPLPVISKFEYMVDGYGYDEAMKHDGYSLAQRFWFKPKKTNAFVWTDSKPTEKVDIYIPDNATNTLTLNYKNENNSILRKFFNSSLNLSSNKVKLEAYITVDEYNLIKNGARIKFDKTVYIPTEINYNPNGESPAEITMMKL